MPCVEPPSSAQTTCLICIPGLHDPRRYKDRWGLTPILLGKSRVAQFQSTTLGIQAQGRTISLNNDFDHCRSLLLFLPLVTPVEAFLPLVSGGTVGFPYAELEASSARIYFRGRRQWPLCLFTYTCFLCLPLNWETHQRSLSKPLISYCDSVYTIRINPLLIQISTPSDLCLGDFNPLLPSL